MRPSHSCSKALALSILATVCGCSGALDRSDGASSDPAEAVSAGSGSLDAGSVSVDAGLDAGSGTFDAGLPFGSRPRDRCSPSGEGDLQWAPCDVSRGLVCVPPDRRLLDAPSTCQCPAGKVFTEGACVAQ